MIMKDHKSIDTTFCRHLKCKNPSGSLRGESKWYVLDDPNTIYWCAKSIVGAIGPDNGSVDPYLCVSGRKCFRKPDD